MSTSSDNSSNDSHKLHLAIFGASGFIAKALLDEVAYQYVTTAVTRSPHRAKEGSPGKPITWQSCDFFSQTEVDQVLHGIDLAVYLAHTRIPTARLDQARCEDMDVLQADNFAHAASLNKVKQIIYLSGLIPEGNVSPQLLQRRSEVAKTLGRYGTPVTTLRTSLVIGPGSTALRFLGNIVRRSPVIIVPKWALTSKQPIALDDLIRAICRCLNFPETFGRSYDIGGPNSYTIADIFEQAAETLKKKRKVIIIPTMPKRLYTWLLRLLSPRTHPGLVRLFVEGMQHHMKVTDNPLQRFVLEKAVPPLTALEPYLDPATRKMPDNPRRSSLEKDKADFSDKSSVRSIQRILLPPGTGPAWLADHYFDWLQKFVWPVVMSTKDSSSSWSIRIRGLGITLLSLTFSKDHSSTDRRLYHITGGLLARTSSPARDRMEFRRVATDDSALVAIHDFTPSLPWKFYNATQAVMHGWVMKAYQRHMRRHVKQRQNAG